MKRPLRGFAVWAIVMVALVVVSQMLWSMSAPTNTKIEYEELIKLVQADQIERIAIMENELVGLTKDSKIAATDFPSRYDFECVVDRDRFFEMVRLVRADELGKAPEMIGDHELGFAVDYLQRAETPWFMEFLPYLVVLLLLMAFWMFFMRQQQGGNSKVMNFGKSRARISDPTTNKIRFKDVAGADEEKEELQEIVEFLRNPKRFTELGARIPKGVLLVGPPGTGKTLLAKAVAGEAGVPFFTISGSDFVEMFVGVGASRVRDLFELAKKNHPSIVFIDEIDAVGRHRGAGLGGGHDEREQTLNQLLVEMDGFSSNEGVIVLAATNRHDILDPALLRPGRFDRQITVSYPDVQGRFDILKVHSHGKPLAEDVDLLTVARRTPFYTGADLENVLNEAAILAARAGEKQIHTRFLEEAITRVGLGPEKRSRKVTERDRKLSAYHEAGHAIVGLFNPESDEVHMVTIIPRGNSGGHTQFLPSEETSNATKKELLARICVSLGGFAAELLQFGDVTTGSGTDIRHATQLARRMITQFGMSDELGPVYMGGDQEVFLGRDYTQSRSTSEVVAAKIDEEIRKYIVDCQQEALDLLKKYDHKLQELASLLLEHETVDRSMLDAFMRDESIPSLDKRISDKKKNPEASNGEVPY